LKLPTCGDMTTGCVFEVSVSCLSVASRLICISTGISDVPLLEDYE
jgi:hypothetical protein